LYATVENIAAEKINASYMGRLMRLTLLSRDIFEAIPERTTAAGKPVLSEIAIGGLGIVISRDIFARK
jgi:hypothetical protein